MKKKFSCPLLGCAALMYRIATRFTLAMTYAEGVYNRYCEGVSPRQSGATRFKHPQFAFSLIELLISLIIISCIVAAFAPVMTKKLKHGGISISNAAQKLTLDCPPEVGSACQACLGSQCINCPESVKTGCGTGHYFDFFSCKCNSCADTNCAVCTADLTTCSACKPGYVKKSDGECGQCDAGQYIALNTCTDCPKGYRCDKSNYFACNSGLQYQDEIKQSTCKTCTGNNASVSSDRTTCTTFNCPVNCKTCSSSTVCTTCNDGYKKNASGVCEKIECKYGEIEKNGNCENPCADFHNAFFMPTNPTAKRGICMTKINAGDDTSSDTPQIPSKVDGKTVSIINAKNGATDTNTQKGIYKCWKATATINTAADTCSAAADLSALPVLSGYNNFGYNGCTRTLCTWEVAKGTCEAFYSSGRAWRLPTQAELTYIKNNLALVNTKLGSNGLQLCDWNGGYGAPRCDSVRRCQGAYYYCEPYRIWGEEYSSGSVYAYRAYLGSGVLLVSNRSKSNAMGVRCVLDIDY